MTKARRITITVLAILVGWAGSAAMAIWAAASHTTQQAERVEAGEKAHVDHEIRLRLLEASRHEFNTHVLWIREALLRIEKRLDLVKP